MYKYCMIRQKVRYSDFCLTLKNAFTTCLICVSSAIAMKHFSGLVKLLACPVREDLQNVVH